MTIPNQLSPTEQFKVKWKFFDEGDSLVISIGICHYVEQTTKGQISISFDKANYGN